MNFYISYNGNKRKEIKNFINLININDYDNIIEPFGGSLSFSRFIYNDIDKDKRLKYYISDINNELVFFCNNFYKNKINIINETLEDINKIKNKVQFNEYVKNNKNINDEDFIKYYLFINKFYRLRRGFYPGDEIRPKLKDYNIKTLLTDDFFKNNEYKALDFKIYLEQFKNDERSLIFLDPPYFNSDNSFYIDGVQVKNNDCNNFWEYLYNFVNNCKCKFILVVNNNIFMKLAFNNFFKLKYDKKYENSKFDKEQQKYIKNSCEHMVFSNI